MERASKRADLGCAGQTSATCFSLFLLLLAGCTAGVADPIEPFADAGSVQLPPRDTGGSGSPGGSGAAGSAGMAGAPPAMCFGDLNHQDEDELGDELNRAINNHERCAGDKFMRPAFDLSSASARELRCNALGVGQGYVQFASHSPPDGFGAPQGMPSISSLAGYGIVVDSESSASSVLQILLQDPDSCTMLRAQGYTTAGIGKYKDNVWVILLSP